MACTRCTRAVLPVAASLLTQGSGCSSTVQNWTNARIEDQLAVGCGLETAGLHVGVHVARLLRLGGLHNLSLQSMGAEADVEPGGGILEQLEL
jgi:hypothetical protein